MPTKEKRHLTAKEIVGILRHTQEDIEWCVARLSGSDYRPPDEIARKLNHSAEEVKHIAGALERFVQTINTTTTQAQNWTEDLWEELDKVCEERRNISVPRYDTKREDAQLMNFLDRMMVAPKDKRG